MGHTTPTDAVGEGACIEVGWASRVERVTSLITCGDQTHGRRRTMCISLLLKRSILRPIMQRGVQESISISSPRGRSS